MPRKMKESDSQLLGLLPSNWECNVVRRYYNIILGKMLCPEKLDESYSLEKYYCAANVHFDGVSDNGLKAMWFSPSEKREYGVREGDLLVVEGGAGAGGAAIAGRQRGFVGVQNSVMIVRPKKDADVRLLKYWLQVVVPSGYIDCVCNRATIPHFTKDKIGNMKIPYPPSAEQRRIAAYLDERCAKIDGMIAEAKASIEDYNIYRQDVIDCLANFGSCSIDRVKVRDSGNVWLNKVPDAWDVLKIGLIFKENCRAPKDEDIPLSLSQKDGLIPTDLMQEHSLKTSTYENWKRVLPDDLVLNRFKAHLGVFYASQYTGIVSFHYGVFVARRPLSVKYYEYLFHSTPYRRMFAEFSNGITVGLQNLSNSSFYSARCVCPPVDVQHRIAAELDEKCAAIDKLVGEKEALIADLEAYKKSLIFETVTGKREVA